MKKSFVAVALVMGLGTTVAFAENLTSGVETVMAVNDLPAAVTEAIAKNFAESTVKEAAEDGSKTYQVVLTDKEGTESTVFFNEKGEILK